MQKDNRLLWFWIVLFILILLNVYIDLCAVFEAFWRHRRMWFSGWNNTFYVSVYAIAGKGKCFTDVGSIYLFERHSNYSAVCSVDKTNQQDNQC